MSVEFELSVWEGARLVRRLPKQKNSFMDAGLDLVAGPDCWGQLCHAAVVGTGNTTDLIAAGGATALGGIVITAGGHVAIANDFFLVGMVSKTLVFDAPDDTGRVSWIITAVTDTKHAIVADVLAGAVPPAFTFAPGPTTIYVLNNIRVTLDAAVKVGTTDASGNLTTCVTNPLGFAGWPRGNRVTWTHRIPFSAEVAPQSYNEIGWLPESHHLITDQLFGRALIPGGILVDTGQHLIAVVSLQVDFWPVVQPVEADCHFSLPLVGGSNVFLLRDGAPDAVYETFSIPTIKPADGYQLWSEPSTLRALPAVAKRAWILSSDAGAVGITNGLFTFIMGKNLFNAAAFGYPPACGYTPGFYHLDCGAFGAGAPMPYVPIQPFGFWAFNLVDAVNTQVPGILWNVQQQVRSAPTLGGGVPPAMYVWPHLKIRWDRTLPAIP